MSETPFQMQLDDEMLAACGLGLLAPSDRRVLLQSLYDDLELRVGLRLSSNMTDEQLEEFELIIDFEAEQVPDPSDSPSAAWLAANRPDYRDVAKEIFLDVLAELAEQRIVIAEAAGVALEPLADGFPLSQLDRLPTSDSAQ